MITKHVASTWLPPIRESHGPNGPSVYLLESPLKHYKRECGPKKSGIVISIKFHPVLLGSLIT